ncbi:MAG TPA: hypothetical protein VLY85_05015, partial [Thermoplasmata archaeon]|nr:hypothetical protein [Thermoplasmata archaeon]
MAVPVVVWLAICLPIGGPGASPVPFDRTGTPALALSVGAGGGRAGPAAIAPEAGARVPPMTLFANATPSAICGYGLSNCASGTGQTRVTLTARTAPPTGAWSSVQVLFLLETTPYDGVYDSSQGDPGYDLCALSNDTHLCEESSAVPEFANGAGALARSIA